MFYLPIYLQSIHGQSAITSGINTLPFLAFFGVGAILGGAVIGKYATCNLTSWLAVF